MADRCCRVCSSSNTGGRGSRRAIRAEDVARLSLSRSFALPISLAKRVVKSFLYAALVLVPAIRVWSDDTPAPRKTTDSTTRSVDNPDAALTPAPTKKLFAGRVVNVFESLKRRGIKAYPEELKDQIALETADGELIPILPDWRGRAFFQDERLRHRKVEVIGFRRDGLPYLNVMEIYTFDEKGQRQYTDYWCDICSIPMYEIKPCDCCQQEIRLRFQTKAGKSEISNPKSETNSKSQ